MAMTIGVDRPCWYGDDATVQTESAAGPILGPVEASDLGTLSSHPLEGMRWNLRAD